MKTEICLSLGSNLGDRVANLTAARAKIAALSGVEEAAASSLYETEPVAVDPRHAQLLFINAVLVLQTGEDIGQIATRLRRIEAETGLKAGKGLNLPRTIDIDIVCAGDMAVDTPELTIPHPRWRTRRFVVEPLAEVRPLLRVPGAGQTVSEILRGMPARPAVRRLDIRW